MWPATNQPGNTYFSWHASNTQASHMVLPGCNLFTVRHFWCATNLPGTTCFSWPPPNAPKLVWSGPVWSGPVWSSPVLSGRSSPVQSTRVQSSQVWSGKSSLVLSNLVRSCPVQSSPIQSSRVQYAHISRPHVTCHEKYVRAGKSVAGHTCCKCDQVRMPPHPDKFGALMAARKTRAAR